MKTVFEGRQTAHVWAQQRQPSGRSTNGSISFETRTIFSYGPHYPLGYIDGEGRAWLNSDKYSPTTSKHQGYVWQAVQHRERFTVPNLADLLGIFEYVRRFNDNGAIARAVRYLEANRGKLADETAIEVLRIVQVPNPAAAWQKSVRKLQKQETARIIAAKKAADRAALDDAGDFGNMSAHEFNRRILWHYRARLHNFEETHKDLIKRLLAAKKISEARGHKVRVKTLAMHLAATRHALKVIRASVHKVRAHEIMRDSILVVRRMKETFDGKAVALSSHALKELRRACGIIHDNYPRTVPGITADSLALLDAKYQETHDREMAIRQAELQEQARIAAAERAERVAFWRDGGAVRLSYQDTPEYTMMRVVGAAMSIADRSYIGTLETSQGAEVPLSHAVKVFQFVKLCRERGEGWTKNGRTLRVGHFGVDAVAPDGSFKAGCHDIGWNEIERLATRLGLFDIAATDTTTQTAAH